MPEYHVLNLGAGVQSSALYLLAHNGKIHFDVAIFADTQEEPQAVYDHLRYLTSLGAPTIWIRTAGRLGHDLLAGRGPTRRFASIPAFTRGPDGKVGAMPRQCSAEYKVEVIEKAIRRELVGLRPRQRMKRDVHIHQYFGISADEAGRAERIRRRRHRGNRYTTPHFPLLEMGWSRKDCIAYLKTQLPHAAPRSACVFCPYHSNREWSALKDDPVAWARAVEIDRALRLEDSACNRRMRDPMFLHRLCRPLE